VNNRLQRIVDWRAVAVECGFQVKSLAKKFEVSDRTVRRHFEKRFGMTAKAWMDRERIVLATERVLKGEAVKVVATELHFKQRSNFSDYFKRHTGEPPTHYANNA
jgi:transcriptional regulator GlxA family with amidase domain